MMAVFDHSAQAYDETFTHTIIGAKQRQVVWDYLHRRFPSNKPVRILELNGGTGEDAIFLAKLGHNVVCTDISDEMNRVAQAKINRENLTSKIVVRQLDSTHLHHDRFDEKFDLIFSNFGGMNCLAPDEMRQVFHHAKSILRPDGRFITVLMPRICIIETLSFLMRGRLASAFRRNTTNPINVHVDGKHIKTYYYAPQDIRKLTSKVWSAKACLSVGFIPSYMEHHMHGKSIVRYVVTRLNSILRRLNIASWSDHYLIGFSLDKIDADQ